MPIILYLKEEKFSSIKKTLFHDLNKNDFEEDKLKSNESLLHIFNED